MLDADQTQSDAAGQTDMMEMQTGTETQRSWALVKMRHSVRSPESPPNAPPECLQMPLDTSGNSLRPFYTAQKPACGFGFSWHTDHRRRHNDLQACNPVMWRSQCVSKPQ
ncbi:hypothetical protein cypCar_00050296 [Cyprinus carpio]|nr:hypothetical protein cypCar_00050296 [Cyprinus carpio]